MNEPIQKKEINVSHGGRGNSKTNKVFASQVRSHGDKQFELLSEYINSTTKVLMKHKICGKIYEIYPNNFLNHSGCPHCGRERAKQALHKLNKNRLKNKCLKTEGGKHSSAIEVFIERVHQLTNGEYQPLTDYIKSNVKLQMKHELCGHVYPVTPNQFLNGNRCPKCAKIKRKKQPSKSNETFKKEVEMMGAGEYVVCTPYQKAKTELEMEHLPCGQSFNIKPTEFIAGKRCPICFPKRNRVRKTHADYVEVVKEIGQGEYELVSEYKHSKQHVQMKHLVCNEVFPVRPDIFSNGSRCPKCRKSKGELMIESILKGMDISYTTQVRFDDCRRVYPLPFDFGIVDKDGRVVFLIEYDGLQHFNPVDYFGGKETFVERIKNDRIKSNYAKENKIPLLRLSYQQEEKEMFLRRSILHVVSSTKK